MSRELDQRTSLPRLLRKSPGGEFQSRPSANVIAVRSTYGWQDRNMFHSWRPLIILSHKVEAETRLDWLPTLTSSPRILSSRWKVLAWRKFNAVKSASWALLLVDTSTIQWTENVPISTLDCSTVRFNYFCIKNCNCTRSVCRPLWTHLTSNKRHSNWPCNAVTTRGRSQYQRWKVGKQGFTRLTLTRQTSHLLRWNENKVCELLQCVAVVTTPSNSECSVPALNAATQPNSWLGKRVTWHHQFSLLSLNRNPLSRLVCV